MDDAIAHAVRTRARHRCEYCRLPQAHVALPFEIEHIIPDQHRGTDAFSNLAYSCLHCNRHKGPNLAGIDRVTSRTKLVRLFNPRRHQWGYHFELDGPVIVGRTPIGRVTVDILQMNQPLQLMLREELMEESLYP